jgi:D-alanyl-D-alanine carboxypeptidase
MLPSGNDAAFALAEYIGRLLFKQTEEYKRRLANPSVIKKCRSTDFLRSFINEMNKTARELRISST